MNAVAKEVFSGGNTRKAEIIEEAMENPLALCSMKNAATESFNDACKAVAKKAEIDPAVLKTYVAAIVNDKIEECARKSDQLAFLFEERFGQ